MLTPFHRLVVAARHAAFKNETVTPSEVSRVLRQDAGRLVMWVQLRGKREDFARHFAPKVLVGTREIKPTFVQNERTAAAPEGGAFVARWVYAFPIREINGRDRLVIREATGRPVSRFAIDLAKMR